MSYDVVVVGGGIGGVTVAALLSARGMSVCLLERQSQVGGCAGRVQFSGLDFEPGMGMYRGWGPGEIHQQIFSELNVKPPATSRLTNEIVVRLADGADITLSQDSERFFSDLRRVFPENARQAVEFYQSIERAATLSQTRASSGSKRQGIMQDVRSWLRSAAPTAQEQTLDQYLHDVSPRFRAFIDAQLRAFANTSVERCSLLVAGQALDIPRNGLFSIAGGPAALAESLARSISNSGGKVRLDTPVLRLAYDQNGTAVGVDLLNGETVSAKRAIISNMTIWDTYGKLIGLKRTPPEVRSVLTNLESDGVFLIYASMEEAAADRLPSELMLVAPGSSQGDEEAFSEFTFATNFSAATGTRAVTIKARTNVNEWFAFQSSEDDYERWDQEKLETLWSRLHRALPELGGDIEVVETANPRTFYEQTRRKLGMVLGRGSLEHDFDLANCQTTLPNVFMVGDTVSTIPKLSSVSECALAVADFLCG